MPKTRILVDTCIIIEAFRTNCWKALCNAFDVETVEECVNEACAGDPLTPGRTPIDRTELLQGLAQQHAVSSLQLATLWDDHSDLPGIDDGELHLMAWLHANKPIPMTLLLSTADTAAIRAASVIGLLDKVRSLEELGKTAGVGKSQLERLQNHFRDRWLSELRIKLALGHL